MASSPNLIFEIDKRECSELNYGFDWNVPADEWLEPGETIPDGGSTWSVSPPGLTILANSVIDGTKTVVRLAGGVVGQVYTVQNHIVTSPSGDEECSDLIVTVTP